MDNGALDYGVLNMYLSRYKLESMGTAEKRAQRLNNYFVKLAENGEIQLAKCDKCFYHSDANLEQCPFCGDREGIIGIDIIPQQTKLHPLKESEGELKEVNVTRIDRENLEIYGEKDLDKVLSEIKVCSRMASEQIYKVGQLLKVIHDYDLWQHKLDKFGRRKYKSFSDCIEKEIGMKRTYSSRLVKIVGEFTEKDLEEYGVTRLYFGGRVEPKERKQFLEKAKNISTEGPTLKNMVHEINEKKDLPQQTLVVRPEPQEEMVREEPLDVRPAEPQPRVRQIISNKKTVDIELGLKTVPMWVKPKGHARVNQPTEPAMSITDRPWFFMPVSDDLFLSVKIRTGDTGEIEAIVEFRTGRVIND